MKINKKELIEHLPPCRKCGLCKNFWPYRVKRGDWGCSEMIDRQASKVIERDCQRLWALSDLWNLAFDTYCSHDETDNHDITVCRIMKADAMEKYVKKAKEILRMTDVDQIKKLRNGMSERYHGKR